MRGKEGARPTMVSRAEPIFQTIASTIRDALWRAWQPIPVFLPGESNGQKRLEGYSSWGHKEFHTTEWLTFGITHTWVPSTNKENTNWAPVLAPASAANNEALDSRFSQENVSPGLCPLCELTGHWKQDCPLLVKREQNPLPEPGNPPERIPSIRRNLQGLLQSPNWRPWPRTWLHDIRLMQRSLGKLYP